MLRAIAKKKNDSIDAGKIADCLRCDFLPECYMAATEIRERRRTLRYRHLLVRQMVQMKNRVSGLLMETGVSHNRQRLHKVGYFPELLGNADAVSASIRPLLQLSRESITRLQRTEGAIIRSLQRDQLLAERVRRLQTIPAVGKVTALSWALEMGDISRFRSIRQAISYSRLCGDEKRSADKVARTPISKQRNKHIQRVLVEAAKFLPRAIAAHVRERGDVLGTAIVDERGVGFYAYVFYDHVQRLAEERKLGHALLGDVLAHEIGHLLLGSNSHSVSGIMSAHWYAEELRRISEAAMFFAPSQSRMMRDRVALRQVDVPAVTRGTADGSGMAFDHGSTSRRGDHNGSSPVSR